MNSYRQPEPCVSIIIPTYNRQSLIAGCIQSVLDQTFGDLEILVVDDGSTDHTEQVINEIGDPRIIYLTQPHSGLPAVGRNTGIRHARGEYLAFLDSDDLWCAEKLRRQVSIMESHEELGLTHTGTCHFWHAADECSEETHIDQEVSIWRHAFEKLYGNPIIANSSVIIRRSAQSKVGLFNEDPGLRAVEDYEYWIRIARFFPIGFINQTLVKYRQHGEGISKNRIENLRAKLYLLDLLDRTFPDSMEVLEAKRRKWLANIHYRLGRAQLDAGRSNLARSYLRRSWKDEPKSLVFWVASFFGPRVHQSIGRGFRSA